LLFYDWFRFILNKELQLYSKVSKNSKAIKKYNEKWQEIKIQPSFMFDRVGLSFLSLLNFYFIWIRFFISWKEKYPLLMLNQLLSNQKLQKKKYGKLKTLPQWPFQSKKSKISKQPSISSTVILVASLILNNLKELLNNWALEEEINSFIKFLLSSMMISLEVLILLNFWDWPLPNWAIKKAELRLIKFGLHSMSTNP